MRRLALPPRRARPPTSSPRRSPLTPRVQGGLRADPFWALPDPVWVNRAPPSAGIGAESGQGPWVRVRKCMAAGRGRACPGPLHARPAAPPVLAPAIPPPVPSQPAPAEPRPLPPASRVRVSDPHESLKSPFLFWSHDRRGDGAAGRRPSAHPYGSEGWRRRSTRPGWYTPSPRPWGRLGPGALDGCAADSVGAACEAGDRTTLVRDGEDARAGDSPVGAAAGG
jgi:hypothetical protein